MAKTPLIWFRSTETEVRIEVVHSFPVKDQLKAEGFTFGDPELDQTYGKVWGKTVARADAQAAANWVKSTGWTALRYNGTN